MKQDTWDVNNETYKKQHLLETESHFSAREKLEQKLKDSDLTPAELNVLNNHARDVTDALIECLEDINFGSTEAAPKKVPAVALMFVTCNMTGLGFSLLAKMLMESYLPDDKKATSVAAIASRLGEMVVEQMKLHLALEEDKKSVSKMLENTGWKGQRRNFCERILKSPSALAAFDDLLEAEPTLVLTLGKYVLDVMKTRQFITMTTVGRRPNQATYHNLNDEILGSIDERLGAILATQYVKKPMLIKPRSFVETGKGGWISQPITGVERHRSNFHGHDDRSNLKLPPRYAAACDQLASTPYRIRPSILSVAEELAKQGYMWVKGDGGLFNYNIDALPLRVEYDEDNPQPYFDRKELRAAISKENSRMRSLKLAIEATLTTCKEYVHEPALYFPVSCDWRGRLYYRTPHLSPQGNTFCKGVLEFTEGKPLGKDGLRYLYRFAASVWTADKVDKAEFESQEEWAADNLELLIDIANNPLDHVDHWTTTDSPFEFLAACEDIRDAHATRNPETYVSHLPCRIDAVCSGVQHLAALTRDENVAASVCLTGQNRGTDYYTLIKDEAEGILESLTQDQWLTWLSADSKLRVYDAELMAKCIMDLGGLNRKDCKPIGMQRTYNVGPRTIAQRWRDEPSRKWVERITNYFEDIDDVDGKLMSFRIPQLVAKVLFRAVDQCSGKCMSAMDWYQNLTAGMSDHNLGTKYLNPAGFAMQQKYFKQQKSYVYSPMGKMRVLTTTDEVHKTKQVDGISANVTHSNDSALVVLSAEGFAGTLTVIHDSLGTHACDVSALLTSIQEAMVRMYDGPVLSEMLKTNEATLPEGEDISRVLPSEGDFDLNEMLTARYLFC